VISERSPQNCSQVPPWCVSSDQVDGITAANWLASDGSLSRSELDSN